MCACLCASVILGELKKFESCNLYTSSFHVSLYLNYFCHNTGEITLMSQFTENIRHFSQFTRKVSAFNSRITKKISLNLRFTEKIKAHSRIRKYPFMPLITFSKLRHFTRFEFVVLRCIALIQCLLLAAVNGSPIQE